MWTGGAGGAATAHGLLSNTHFRSAPRLGDDTDPLKMSLGEHVEAPQPMFVEVSNIVEKISIQTHGVQATSAGANKRIVLRRSVSVHPMGGVKRSAWVAHTG